MPFEIVRNDITKLKVDAIVNAANRSLEQGGGVCGAIFAAAGAAKLQKACDKIGSCETGQAVITKGYALPAKYIIHTVGPIWRGGEQSERDLLYACYQNALMLAKENRCESVAFPLISVGMYGYPKDQARRVAVAAIGDFLLKHDMTVSLVIFDKSAFSLNDKLHFAINSFIDDHYYSVARSIIEESLSVHDTASFEIAELMADVDAKVCEDHIVFAEESERLEPPATAMKEVAKQSVAAPKPAPVIARSLDNALAHLDETFSERLLRLIDETQRADADVYKRANIDRRVFSKIRSNKDYRPSKNTALAFAVALELSLDDTRDLLMKAGFALSRSNKLDVIVEYFIGKQKYNIFEINEALFAFDQNLLGA